MTTVDELACRPLVDTESPHAAMVVAQPAVSGTPTWALRPALLPAASALLIGGIYWPTAVELIRIWSVDPNYSHGFLVPVVSLGLAVWAAQQHGDLWGVPVSGAEAYRGLLEMGLGFGLHLVAFLLRHLVLDVVALICLLRGLFLTLGGRDANRALGFAALFLLFMAPLPIGWYQPVARWMQQLVSVAAAGLLELGGAAVYREGYLLHLPGYTLEVGEACSGMRQLTTILALAVAVGYFASSRRWYRWTLAVAALPVALAANCVRVILAGVALYWWGPRWAEGVLHTLEGVTTAVLASGLLLGLAWGLSRWDQDAGVPAAKPRAPAPHPLGRRTRWVLILVALGGGGLGQFALWHHVAAAGPPPAETLLRPLAELPLVFPDWQGQAHPVDDPRLLAGDERLSRRYRRGPDGPAADVWLVYSQVGADRGHHPEVCMAVAGQTEDPAGRATVAVPGHPGPVQQYRFGAPGRSQLVYYWHYTLAAPPDAPADLLQRIYRRSRWRPASVTLEVFMQEQTPADAAWARELVRQLDAALQPHLPPGAVRASDRTPVTVIEG